MLRFQPMQSIVFQSPVLLLGNADLADAEREWAQRWSGPVACADGGARHLGRLSADTVVGDGDSWGVSPPANSILDCDQNTTDLEKLLARITAPQMIGLGFLGGRWDHSLANLSTLLAHPALTLIDEHQKIQGCNGNYQGEHNPGETIGVMPATPCRFQSSAGLKYPLNDLELAPGIRVGSSNQSTHSTVRIDGKGQYWICSASLIVKAAL